MGHFQRILVTTDFSQGAQEGLATARYLATDLGAEVLILHVVEELMLPLTHTSPAKRLEFEQQVEAEARNQLERVAEHGFAGIAARTVLLKGVPHLQILHCAQEEAADLIVIATQGRGAVSQAVFGSTTQRVLQDAPCPVVTVRRPE